MSHRILFTCGRESTYPRNAIIKTCLEHNFEVVSVTDDARWLPLRYLRLACKLSKVARKNFDLFFVGFVGHPLILFLNLLKKRPVVFDTFISIYDTVCFDRQLFKPSSLFGKITFWLDRLSCNLSDLVCLDTKEHVRYFQETFCIQPEKLWSFYVGCDERIFYPRTGESTTPLVLFYGSFLPLQGVDVIVRAAKILENEPGLRFRIIGKGLESKNIKNLARELGIRNIDFLPPVPLMELPEHIRQATICLGGHFGHVDKAARVIAGKTFQCLAMGKATIVGDNPANKELLTHGYDAWFCRMNDPQALANAIRELVYDKERCTNIGKNAYRTFMDHASTQVLSTQLKDKILSVIERRFDIDKWK